MPTLMLSGILAAITTLIAYGALKLGVAVGKHQEYLNRSAPLLSALKLIADTTVSPDPAKRASHQTIHTIAAKNFKIHHPNPAD